MIRLKQWVKNFLVFFPLLIFPHEINLENFNILIITFLLFCCSSSLVYIVNDWLDKDADSVNKNKKHRPFANKDLSFNDAIIGFIFLFIIFIFLFLKIYETSFDVCILISIYLIQNFLYSFYLKNITLLEMLIVSTGYSYRALAGGLSLSLVPSSWMLLTIFLASIFIVAQKRISDRMNVKKQTLLRPSTKVYSNNFLNLITSIAAGSAIISYILFTLSDYAQLKFQNPYLPISSIFIIYATLRYIQISMSSLKAHDPINLIFRDKHMQICILAYFIFIIFTNSF